MRAPRALRCVLLVASTVLSTEAATVSYGLATAHTDDLPISVGYTPDSFTGQVQLPPGTNSFALNYPADATFYFFSAFGSYHAPLLQATHHVAKVSNKPGPFALSDDEVDEGELFGTYRAGNTNIPETGSTLLLAGAGIAALRFSHRRRAGIRTRARF